MVGALLWIPIKMFFLSFLFAVQTEVHINCSVNALHMVEGAHCVPLFCTKQLCFVCWILLKCITCELFKPQDRVLKRNSLHVLIKSIFFGTKSKDHHPESACVLYFKTRLLLPAKDFTSEVA